MAPRGPDGAGSWSAGCVALAHRRLKIIDLSEQGSQPLVDPHVARAVAFNGCIYNHRELRAELEREGHRFFSTSDTEVIAKAHATWGDRCVERFMGMFSFALAERETGRLLLARDRLGIKPLYLAEVAGALRFGSTLPGLLAGGGVDTSIDPVALHHYLSWHGVVPPPHTMLKGVRKLQPATILAIEPDGRRTRGAVLVGGPQPAARAGDLGRARLAGRAPRRAADCGRPADGRRRPGGGAALRRPRLEPHRRRCWRRPASAGWRPSRSASSRAAAARGTSSGTPTSSRTSSRPSTTRSRSRRRAWSRRSTARSRR